MQLHIAHTADLGPATLTTVRAFLDGVFGDWLDEHDWEHALGGMHALAWDGEELIGHASLVQRRMLHGGRALRTGYLEAVAVRADRRRRGVGTALMEPLERLLRGAYDLGALAATDDGAGLYASRGWQRWQGPTATMSPTGIVRTPGEDGSVFVLELSAPLDLAGELVCDWRDGDVW